MLASAQNARRYKRLRTRHARLFRRACASAWLFSRSRTRAAWPRRVARASRLMRITRDKMFARYFLGATRISGSIGMGACALRAAYAPHTHCHRASATPREGRRYPPRIEHALPPAARHTRPGARITPAAYLTIAYTLLPPRPLQSAAAGGYRHLFIRTLSCRARPLLAHAGAAATGGSTQRRVRHAQYAPLGINLAADALRLYAATAHQTSTGMLLSRELLPVNAACCKYGDGVGQSLRGIFYVRAASIAIYLCVTVSGKMRYRRDAHRARTRRLLRRYTLPFRARA